MKKYEVIEDNGGGLTLVVFGNNGNVEYLHTGYEYNVGQLAEDLIALQNGDNPAIEWEGNEESPQEMYDNITSYEYGWEVVADNDGIYSDKMGSAATEEFNKLIEKEYEIEKNYTKSKMGILYSFVKSDLTHKEQFEEEVGEDWDDFGFNGEQHNPWIWEGKFGWVILTDSK